MTFTATDWNTPQTVTITGTDDADLDDDTAVLTAVAVGGDYDSVTATVDVAVTDDDTPLFTAAEAESYVEARDCVVQGMSYSAGTHGTFNYQSNYQSEADWCGDGHLTNQGLSPLNPLIPLGQDDPNSLPSPADEQALRDAIDGLTNAVGLPQWMIDDAEGG